MHCEWQKILDGLFDLCSSYPEQRWQRNRGLLAKCPCAAVSARRRNVALLMALVATICAVMVGAVFVLAWRDEDVLLTALLGIVLFSLLVLAMLAVGASL